MKCHYEILEVDRDADDAAIKQSYRKLALRWHPDKNMDNVDEAKKKFQVIQQAYEVLSDPQERAWYDRHREQILRGSDTYSDESLDVFQYFTVTCYRGYDDAEGGFYAVYREVFTKLAAEDLDFMDSDEESTDIPEFGRADSDYDEVVGPFYAYWSGYCTKKTYDWLCPHDITEIRDRRILRHIEKDTKKLAQKARKDRNDEVRALVAFVKKRDRRVQEYRRLLEYRAEQNRAKQEEKRLDQIRRNRAEVEEQMRLQKESGIGKFSGDYEAQLRQMEAAYGKEDDDEESDTDSEEDEDELSVRLKDATELNGNDSAADSEDVYIDHLYCVACNKSFKNESSMQNHQTSKKHNENIEKLRIEMLEEEAHKETISDEEIEAKSESDGETLPIETQTKRSKKSKRKAQKARKSLHEQVVKDETEGDLASEPDNVTPLAEPIADEQPQDDEFPQKLQTKKARRRAKQSTSANVAQETPIVRKASKQHDASDESGSDSDCWDSGARRNRKAASKQRKPAAPKKQAITEIDETVDIDHICVTCAAKFDSKNKLFAHLKQMNHGVYIEGKGQNPSRAVAASAAAPRGKGRKK